MSSPPYHLSVDGFPQDHFRVHAFVGKETISEAYSFEITVTAPLDADQEIERAALGQRATMIWNVGNAPRAFYGVLAAVRHEGVQGTDDFVKLRLRLVPRLWLLKRKKRTRIYQNMRVPDVVTAVLLEAGLVAKWQLLHVYPVREYCTQYEESDYRFVTRLLAEAGIYFYFPEGPPVDAAALAAATIAGAAGSIADSAVSAFAGPAAGAMVGDLAAAAAPLIPGDTVVCGDDASWYPAIGGDSAGELAAAGAAAMLPEVGAAFGGLGDAGDAVLGGASAVAGAVIAAATSQSAPTLYYLAMQQTANSHADKITRFAAHDSVQSDVATFREYDPLRPTVQPMSAAASTQPFAPSPAEIASGAAYVAGAMAAGAAPLLGAAGGALGAVSAVAGAVDSLIGQLSPASNLEQYEHHDPFLFPKWPAALEEASRILRQARRRASMADGESGCPKLAPGHRFALEDHPASHLDRPYVVTSVEHHAGPQPQSGEPWIVYRNVFECARAEVTYVPPRPKRKSVQVSLTATVVGPPGAEIHVDPMGQIKVQFHWN